MEQFSQNIYWCTDVHQQKASNTWKDQTDLHGTSRVEKKRKQDKTCAAGMELKKKKGSCTLGSILTRREVTWDRKGASEAKEESATTVCGKQDREKPAKMVGAPTLCIPAWDRCPLVRAGLGAKTQGLEDSPGIRTVIDCMGTAWRAWNVVQLQPGLFAEEAGASSRRKVKRHQKGGVELPLQPLSPTSAVSRRVCPSCLIGWLQCQALPQQAPGELERCQEVTHVQRQGWNHSWAPGTRQFRKQGWKLSPCGCVSHGFMPLVLAL